MIYKYNRTVLEMIFIVKRWTLSLPIIATLCFLCKLFAFSQILKSMHVFPIYYELGSPTTLRQTLWDQMLGQIIKMDIHFSCLFFSFEQTGHILEGCIT